MIAQIVFEYLRFKRLSLWYACGKSLYTGDDEKELDKHYKYKYNYLCMNDIPHNFTHVFPSTIIMYCFGELQQEYLDFFEALGNRIKLEVLYYTLHSLPDNTDYTDEIMWDISTDKRALKILKSKGTKFKDLQSKYRMTFEYLEVFVYPENHDIKNPETVLNYLFKFHKPLSKLGNLKFYLHYTGLDLSIIHENYDFDDIFELDNGEEIIDFLKLYNYNFNIKYFMTNKSTTNVLKRIKTDFTTDDVGDSIPNISVFKELNVKRGIYFKDEFIPQLFSDESLIKDFVSYFDIQYGKDFNEITIQNNYHYIVHNLELLMDLFPNFNIYHFDEFFYRVKRMTIQCMERYPPKTTNSIHYNLEEILRSEKIYKIVKDHLQPDQMKKIIWDWECPHFARCFVKDLRAFSK